MEFRSLFLPCHGLDDGEHALGDGRRAAPAERPQGRLADARDAHAGALAVGDDRQRVVALRPLLVQEREAPEHRGRLDAAPRVARRARAADEHGARHEDRQRVRVERDDGARRVGVARQAVEIDRRQRRDVAEGLVALVRVRRAEELGRREARDAVEPRDAAPRVAQNRVRPLERDLPQIRRGQRARHRAQPLAAARDDAVLAQPVVVGTAAVVVGTAGGPRGRDDHRELAERLHGAQRRRELLTPRAQRARALVGQRLRGPVAVVEVQADLRAARRRPAEDAAAPRVAAAVVVVVRLLVELRDARHDEHERVARGAPLQDRRAVAVAPPGHAREHRGPERRGVPVVGAGRPEEEPEMRRGEPARGRARVRGPEPRAAAPVVAGLVAPELGRFRERVRLLVAVVVVAPLHGAVARLGLGRPAREAPREQERPPPPPQAPHAERHARRGEEEDAAALRRERAPQQLLDHRLACQRLVRGLRASHAVSYASAAACENAPASIKYD